MNDNNIRLPIWRNLQSPAPPAAFPVGSQVVLRSCPDAQPGRVVCIKYGRVRVRWDDLNLTTAHRANSLIAVTQECHADGPQLTQDAPEGAQ